MDRVTTFMSNGDNQLSREINEWIRNNPDIQIVSIQYQMDGGWFSALIHYRR